MTTFSYPVDINVLNIQQSTQGLRGALGCLNALLTICTVQIQHITERQLFFINSFNSIPKNTGVCLTDIGTVKK
jgi:hypothetical protein